ERVWPRDQQRDHARAPVGRRRVARRGGGGHTARPDDRAAAEALPRCRPAGGLSAPRGAGARVLEGAGHVPALDRPASRGRARTAFSPPPPASPTASRTTAPCLRAT